MEKVAMEKVTMEGVVSPPTTTTACPPTTTGSPIKLLRRLPGLGRLEGLQYPLRCGCYYGSAYIITVTTVTRLRTLGKSA